MCRALGVAPTHLRAESSALVPVTARGQSPHLGSQREDPGALNLTWEVGRDSCTYPRSLPIFLRQNFLQVM